MKLLLGIVAALLFLVACHQVTDYPPQPKVSRVGTATSTTVVVAWHVSVDEIDKVCKPDNGTSYGCAGLIPGTALCQMHLLRPSETDAFNQEALLKVAGHELLHCLGWRH